MSVTQDLKKKLQDGRQNLNLLFLSKVKKKEN